ncbi:AIPR protein [Flavobacterium sp. NST-5]|uniref:AIPR protein n=1 Tax=Flavobacterium ichthyis TaxID=2698827 RepID=A0ABW9Z5E5_9FLAO|nr:AIPR family protein [Flavobacterium ichthyis]NBL64068.1 AIPR protein [Flavobacterium ichthyis]
MDRITQSFIKELLETEELTSKGESKDFEKLANYSIISNEYNKTFDLNFVTIGDGDDTGVDGISIIVNGVLVENTEEIDDLIEKNGTIEVDFTFIQSKTSSNFSTSELNTFIFGVKDFFSISPKLRRNESLQKFADLANHIYNNAPKLKNNPTCKLFYVTTGKWVGDTNLIAIIESGKEDLESTNLFDSIDIIPIGARELATYYRKTKESVSTTITFTNRLTIPEISGISEAYIGLIPYSEFLKIVANEDQNLLNVFEDNVRDFQGENNDVNSGIASTITNEGSEIFSVLNNGITIVASKISPTGNQFTITDYQIVNGCQTSNVLYNNRNSTNTPNVVIPIKLIATEDDEIKTRITLATNNQTPIKKEQLASLTQFQRSLEQFYNSYENDNKLYYERRSKQYNSDTTVIKSRVITVPYQIKSFAGMFLNEPHNVTSYFGSIVRKLNDGKIQIFDNDHSYFPYYTSAYAYYKLETLFKRGLVDSSYRKVKFHLLMLFRMLNEKEDMPRLNSKKMEQYCKVLLDILYDDDKAIKAFKKCCKVIDEADFDKADKQDVKLVSKTKNLIDYIEK